MNSTHFVCFAALLATAACLPQDRQFPEDESSPGTQQPPSEEEDDDTNQYQMTQSGTNTIITMSKTYQGFTNIFEPMSGSGEQFCEDNGEGSQCASHAGEGAAEQQIGDDLAQAYSMEGQSCATVELIDLSWTKIAVAATFDQCVLPNDGPLDGGITVGAELSPFHMYAEFDSLTVDTVWADGNADLRFNELPSQELQLEIDADIEITFENGASGVELDNASLIADSSGVDLSGALIIANGTDDVAFAADGVHWDAGDCYPSDGSGSFDDDGVNIDVTFLSTTPTDYTVMVSFNGLPAIPYTLPACAQPEA